jgi:hypothetical protein
VRVRANRRLPVIVSGLSSHIVQLQLVKSYARDILARLGVQPENRRWHHGQTNVCTNFLLAFHSSIVSIPAYKSEQTLSGGAANAAGFSHSALYSGVVQSEDQFSRSPE